MMELQTFPRAARPASPCPTAGPWCRSWCEILGIEEEIRVWSGETCTQMRS
jgi:hypothetical protein